MEIDIKSARQKLKLTQENLAKAIGVSFVTINRWENDKAKPSPLAVARLKLLLSEVE